MPRRHPPGVCEFDRNQLKNQACIYEEAFSYDDTKNCEGIKIISEKEIVYTDYINHTVWSKF